MATSYKITPKKDGKKLQTMPRINTEPQNQKIFDPWNSAATGHQRHESAYAGSASWKDTRTLKLARQMRSGDCMREEDVGDRTARAFDGICAPEDIEGELHCDEGRNHTVNGGGEWRWVADDEARRNSLSVRDIRSFMGVGKRKAAFMEKPEKKAKLHDGLPLPCKDKSTPSLSSANSTATSTKENSPRKSNIFAGTTIYINGSTLPRISDHRLKHLLVHHGAKVSISLARKTTTHVLVGALNAAADAGAGGGLSARKLQQEISRGGRNGVKIVGVNWVLESVEAGKRLAESRYEVLRVAEKGQRSIAEIFGR